jgi:phenylacetate-CoA ligase
MSLYSRLISGVLFPLHERLKGHDTVAVLRQLEQTQWWDSARLESLRFSRLRKLLKHAKSSTPYYRDLFAQRGVIPEDLKSMADLARLPLLTKADIRTNLERLRSERAADLRRFNTGGSTGEPLIFYIGKERISHDVAAKWRATRWWGVDIGDPEVVVWGSPIELGTQDRLRYLRDKLLHTQLLPAFEMSDSRVDEFIRKIQSARPKMLFGYPSAIAHIATRARTTGQTMNDLGIKVAFVTAEKLYEHQRELIQQTFGCRVANGYGGRDAGFIAHECPQGGMHITAEDIIVEIVEPAGNPLPAGEAGEIVVTHLATGAFPFIRYRTGDVGVLSDKKCACGRGLPLLKEVQGRSTDFVIAQDGTVMHGLALVYVVRDIPGVRQFKIVQETLGRTRVLLATDQDFIEKDVETIRKGIGKRLGSDVHVEIERVPDIPKEASGKNRYVVSHVSPAENNRVKAQ